MSCGPKSAPTAVPGSQGAAGGDTDVLLTRTRGGAVAVDTPGSFPGISLQRSVLNGAGAAGMAWVVIAEVSAGVPVAALAVFPAVQSLLARAFGEAFM